MVTLCANPDTGGRREKWEKRWWINDPIVLNVKIPTLDLDLGFMDDDSIQIAQIVIEMNLLTFTR